MPRSKRQRVVSVLRPVLAGLGALLLAFFGSAATAFTVGSLLFLIRDWLRDATPFTAGLIVVALSVPVYILVLSLARHTPKVGPWLGRAPRTASLVVPTSLAVLGFSIGYAINYLHTKAPPRDKPLLTFSSNTPSEEHARFVITVRYRIYECDSPIDVALAVFRVDRGSDAREASVTVRFADQGTLGAPLDDSEGNVVPSPSHGILRNEGRAGSLRLRNDAITGTVRRDAPSVSHFSARWLKARNQTSCVLPAAEFLDSSGRYVGAGKFDLDIARTWAAVSPEGDLALDASDSDPEPQTDQSRTGIWKCAATNYRGGCHPVAVVSAKNASDKRDFNLLMIGAGISLGSAFLLEALFRLARVE